jgi:hypothetical protein
MKHSTTYPVNINLLIQTRCTILISVMLNTTFHGCVETQPVSSLFLFRLSLLSRVHTHTYTHVRAHTHTHTHTHAHTACLYHLLLKQQSFTIWVLSIKNTGSVRTKGCCFLCNTDVQTLCPQPLTQATTQERKLFCQGFTESFQVKNLSNFSLSGFYQRTCM